MTISRQPQEFHGQPPETPGSGGRPTKPRSSWLLVVITLAVVAVIAGVTGIVLTAGGEDPKPVNPTPTVVGPTYPDTPEATVPNGEIWEWALGRNLWTDPGLVAYAKDLGTEWGDPGTDANVHSRGFQLTSDSSGMVTAVTLYNDETALGYPGEDTNFSAYQGSLPMGLSWNMTASDLGVVYGAGNQTGGYGIDIAFTYSTANGDQVTVSFVARHERDLPGSPIHSITVTR